MKLDYGPCVLLAELLVDAYPLTGDLLALYVYPSLMGLCRFMLLVCMMVRRGYCMCYADSFICLGGSSSACQVHFEGLGIDSGSPFQVVATLILKKYFLIFNLLPLLKIFLEWPLIADVPLGSLGPTSLSYTPDRIL